MVRKKVFGVLAVFLSLTIILGFSVSSQGGPPQSVLKELANQTGSSPIELNATPSNVSEISSEESLYDGGVDVFEVRGRSLENGPVMAITAGGSSSKKTVKKGLQYTRSTLNFGYSGNSSGSEFMKSSGVKTSKESGRIMMRGGSITGISTSIDDGSDVGEIQVKIYKNGNEVGLRNSFEGISSGVKKDIDRQSRGIVQFNRGDSISVQIVSSEDNSWSNAITSVEITTK
ncbi:MAG: hypothetical protein ABEI74_03015 [Candidatus Pacearchaeota archaeon]